MGKAEAIIRKSSEQVGVLNTEQAKMGERLWSLEERVEATKDKVVMLREKVSKLEVELQKASETEGIGGSKGQDMGPASSSFRDSILAEYLNNAHFKEREVFESSIYVHEGFMKALGQILACSPGLDLFKVYKSFKGPGARASGSVRPRTTKWSTFRAPSSLTEWVAAMAATTAAAAGEPPPEPPSTPMDAISSPANNAHEEDEDAVADRPRPTTAGPSLPRSEPFITTATTSTFQIRRGRKPTLITVATRGESSSPVINKFNSISLQSSPISNPNHTIV
ncbi:hypothetical protein ACLOJK_028463 [Asimina triloba]